MKKLINAFLANLDIALVRKSSYQKMVGSFQKFRAYQLAELIDDDLLSIYFSSLPYSKSQLHQDLFVLSELSFKKNGFFIEFGATNGIDLSNTNLLETKFDWNGILAEPAKIWQKEILKNRKAHIELNCIWKSTGEKLQFNEVTDKKHRGELSTIDAFSEIDQHGNSRKIGHKYEVSTISLLDLLNKYNAPEKIDYLSIDTEGSEYEILNAFDFDAFDVRVITCEHNYTPARDKIYDLLTRNGYERKLVEFSLFDDWYVRR